MVHVVRVTILYCTAYGLLNEEIYKLSDKYSDFNTRKTTSLRQKNKTIILLF